MLGLLISVIVVLLYYVRPSWLMLFWLILEPIIKPLVVFFLNIDDQEAVNQITSPIFYYFNRGVIVILLFELLIRKCKIPRNFYRLIGVWVILSVYFFIHSLLTHFDFSEMCYNIISALYTIVPILVFLLNKKTWPNLNTLFYWVVVIIIIQLLWLYLNSIGVFAYMFQYKEILKSDNPIFFMSGTFVQSNGLADFVSIMYLFITIDFFLRKKISLWLFIIISLSVGFILITTGSKLPIIVTVINLLLCILLFPQKGILYGILLVCLFPFLLLFSSHYTNADDESGAYRIISGFSSFSKSKNSRSTDTTFDISSNLVSQYYWESPLIGCGYSYKGNDMAYPLRFHSSFGLSALKSDAMLAYNLVEFGLMGLLLLLFYYFSIINYSVQALPPRFNRVSHIIYTFFLLFSVTEGGLFYISYYLYIYGYLWGLKRCFDEK